MKLSSSIYPLWTIIMFVYMNIYMCKNYANAFLCNDLVFRHKKYISSSIHDYQYEYQNDWYSGEVPWEFIDLDNVNKHAIIVSNEYCADSNSIDSTIVSIFENTNEYTNTINSEFDNNMMTKAIVSGVMKGFYVQIVSIDNMITYTQCYTNKVIDMDIVLSLLYVIFYEKNKNNEIENLITLKNYNNIQLFEKYVKLRRNSMIVIIVIYVLLFRGISNVE